jgi:hypothetical protein
MAQLLEEFERDIEPLLPREVVDSFKALVRRKLNVFASDIAEKAEDERRGLIQNGVGQAIKDGLHADGPQHG